MQLGCVRSHAHQGPQDVDGEEGDGERDEAHGLQPAAHAKVVLSPPQAQPAGDSRQRRDEEEAHHVAEQRPLFVTRAGVLQPLWSGEVKGEKREWKKSDIADLQA